jgi:uncharacterized DUF497 family protein
MDFISWNEKKNQKLFAERGISFSEVVESLNNYEAIITPHPNTEKYPHQHIIYFKHNNYFFACPVVISNKGIFLKIIYPSRAAKKIVMEEL